MWISGVGNERGSEYIPANALVEELRGVGVSYSSVDPTNLWIKPLKHYTCHCFTPQLAF